MEKLTQKSTLYELWNTPVGHDVLDKLLLQIGKSEKWLTNPLISHMTIERACRLAKGMVGEGFADTLLTLVNMAPPPVTPVQGTKKTRFAQDIFYQIYPRSFKDADGDGVGDLAGILQQLPYLEKLGVTALWLSPVYASPMDDNGYDISDYRAIHPEYGTMQDFDCLLKEVHGRGMKLIMDLVVNHTSDEHPWFQAACKDKNSPYHDYYIWQDGTPDAPPNNWTSFFSGPAWNYYPEVGQWALHLFSKKQMDLNWDNPALRAEVADIVNWWLDKGVDGFRMDVINYVSKATLADGSVPVGNLMGFTGIEHYFYGPHLHEYLHELREAAFAPHKAIMVGETPGVGLEMAKQLTARERGVLDMVFNFDQLETPGHTRFDDYVYDLRYLREYYVKWMQGMPDNCRMSIFWDNHDNPRMLGKIDPTGQHRAPLAKLLAVLQLTLKGTPFLYQGQELGLVNLPFDAVEELRDIESTNLYHELLQKKTPQQAFAKVLCGTRDYARTPMPWAAGPGGGFTVGTPWLRMPNDGPQWNAAAEQDDPESVLHAYQKLLWLRRAHPVFAAGAFEQQYPGYKDLFCYTRTGEGEQYLVLLNLTAEDAVRPPLPDNTRLVYNSYGQQQQMLRPYEAEILRLVSLSKHANTPF